MSELNQKLTRLRSLLDERDLDALLLQRVSSFAWATCGAASHVNTAASDGVGALLITHGDRFLITNTIEAPRFECEENLAACDWARRALSLVRSTCPSIWRGCAASSTRKKPHGIAALAGYEPREIVAMAGATDLVAPRQAYAWNTSITGTKSEDTILVGEQGNEVITSIPGWPMLEVSADDHPLPRPAVLEVI